MGRGDRYAPKRRKKGTKTAASAAYRIRRPIAGLVVPCNTCRGSNRIVHVSTERCRDCGQRGLLRKREHDGRRKKQSSAHSWRLVIAMLVSGTIAILMLACGTLAERTPVFPLRTSSRWIVDATGARVKFACANWSGGGEWLFPSQFRPHYNPQRLT
jgi:hypothetical protein